MKNHPARFMMEGSEAQHKNAYFARAVAPKIDCEEKNYVRFAERNLGKNKKR